jgi:hypothetical protein
VGKKSVVAILFLFLPCAVWSQTVDPLVSSYPPARPPGDLIPPALETYADGDAAAERLSRDAARALWTGTTEVLKRPSLMRYQRSAAATGKPSGKRRYLPILMSAVVPGAGELYLGYVKRGVALMAVEAGAWIGYAHYRSEGLDQRDAYEGFADQHWDLQRWVDNHPLVYPLTGQTIEDLEQIGRDTSGEGVWPGYIPYVSKAEDKQHFYENIGKYDWFISGWSDFDPAIDPFPRDTALRDQYRAMRKESNDSLDNSDRFVYLSLGARVFSLVQTVLLTRRSNDEPIDASENRVSFHARPIGYQGGEIALEYRFK